MQKLKLISKTLKFVLIVYSSKSKFLIIINKYFCPLVFLPAEIKLFSTNCGWNKHINNSMIFNTCTQLCFIHQEFFVYLFLYSSMCLIYSIIVYCCYIMKGKSTVPSTIEIKTPEDVEKMRLSCKMARIILNKVENFIQVSQGNILFIWTYFQIAQLLLR